MFVPRKTVKCHVSPGVSAAPQRASPRAAGDPRARHGAGAAHADGKAQLPFRAWTIGV